MPISTPRIPATAVIITAAALLMTGCAHGTTPKAGHTRPPTSAPAPSAAPSAASFGGVWSGTWTRVTTPRGHGTYRWVLHQHGQRVTGTIEAGNSACLTRGPLTGRVRGTHITLHAVTPSVTGTGEAHATYHGTLAGNTLSGTTVVTCSAGTGFGTWKMTR